MVMSTADGRVRCQGVLGWLFGHKFHRSAMLDSYSYSSDYCYRCGMPKGGWGG